MQRWRADRGLPRGEVLSISQQWELARLWYSNRLDAEWRRRTPQEAEEAFAQVGLVGDFWKLV